MYVIGVAASGWVVERAAAVEQGGITTEQEGNSGIGVAAIPHEDGARFSAAATAGDAVAADEIEACAAVAADGSSVGKVESDLRQKGGLCNNRMFLWLTAADGEAGLDMASDADSEIEEAEQRQRKMIALAQRESSVPWFVPYRAHVDTPANGIHPLPRQGIAQAEIERHFVVRSSSSALAASNALDFDNLSGSIDEIGESEGDNDIMREAVRMRMRDLHSKIQFRPRLSPRSHLLSRTVKKKMRLFNGHLVTNEERETAKGLIAQESLLYEQER